MFVEQVASSFGDKPDFCSLCDRSWERDACWQVPKLSVNTHFSHYNSSSSPTEVQPTLKCSFKDKEIPKVKGSGLTRSHQDRGRMFWSSSSNVTITMATREQESFSSGSALVGNRPLRPCLPFCIWWPCVFRCMVPGCTREAGMLYKILPDIHIHTEQASLSTHICHRSKENPSFLECCF